MRSFSCLILLAPLLLSACHRATAETPSADSPRIEADAVIFEGAAPALTVATVTEGGVAALSLAGRLVWDEDATARVFSPFAGRVVEVLVQPGDVVKAGQTLAVLSSPDYGAAQADGRKARVALALAQQNLARVRDLHEHGVVPAKDVQQAEADAAAADAEAQRAAQRLKLFGGDGDEVTQRYCLRSPVAGTVVERALTAGLEVQAGQAAPLFVVTDLRTLWVQLDGHDADLPRLRPGQAFKIATPAYPGEIFPGTIERVADAIDPVTRSVKVRGRVPNPAHRLKGEMYVTASLELPAPPQPQLPSGAVFLRGNEQFVFVSEGHGAYRRRRVETGPEVNGLLPVRSGVRAGESVVTEGALYLDQLLATRGQS